MLSTEQRQRLSAARSADKPVFIVTPEEALANENSKAAGTKTWMFKAENVRDFAWVSSRKFIWDAYVHKQPVARYPEVLAMSFYPNEAEPIWSKYSTASGRAHDGGLLALLVRLSVPDGTVGQHLGE